MGDEFREALNERLGRLDCVARVGSVLASYYLIQDPRATCPGAEDYMSLLEEIDRLLGGKDAGNCEEAFNDTDAAIARWPAAPGRLELQPARPALRRRAAHHPARVRHGPEDLGRARSSPSSRKRAWKSPPTRSTRRARRATRAFRTRIATTWPAGLLKRALNLEAAGDLAAAFPIWEQLATFPETSMAARQQHHLDPAAAPAR